MSTDPFVYLVFVRNLVVGGFTTFDRAVAYVRQRYGKTDEMRFVVISSCPLNPPPVDDVDG